MSFFANILMSGKFWVAALVIGLAVTAYTFYNKARDAQAQAALQKQNVAALQDSLSKSADSIQTLAVSVRSLNDEATKLKGENHLLSLRVKTVIDSVRATGTSTVEFASDSVGDYVKADFSGKQSIATYSGYTKVYLTALSKPVYKLNLDFDVIEATAELFHDDTDDLFKVRTTSLTPGVKLIGYTTLDSLSYPFLYNQFSPAASDKQYVAYAGMLSGSDFVAGGFAFVIDRWFLSLDYKLFNRWAPDSQPWHEKLVVGVRYGLF